MIKIGFLICSIVVLSCSNHVTNDPGRSTTELAAPTTTKQQASTFSNDSAGMPKPELTKIYVQSITDYIKAVKKEYGIRFDTLYFGKHVYGQPDDFPDIELPETIEHTAIRLITPELGAQKQQENPSSFFINLMGWANYEKAEFIFVTFSNNNQHQFDYYLNYSYDPKAKTFTLDTIRSENFLYPKK